MGSIPTAFWVGLASKALPVVLGAVISAVIAYLLARRSSREILRRDAENRKEAKKAAMIRAAITLAALMDQIADLRQYLTRQLAKRQEPGREHSDLWQLVMARAGHTEGDIPKFDHDSLAVFFEDGELELMQKMSLLQRRCASAHASFLEYCRRREALKDRLPPPEAMDGAIGRTPVTREDILRLKPYTVPLNDLIGSLVPHTDEDWRLGQEVTEHFTVVARRHLGMPNFSLTAKELAEEP